MYTMSDRLAYLNQFIASYDLSAEEQKPLFEGAELLCKNYPNELEIIFEIHRTTSFKIGDSLGVRNLIALKSGIPVFTVNAIVLILQFPEAHDNFKARGWSDEVYHDTMEDLIYKIRECETVKGCVGTFVETWYRIFYLAEIVKLGRLEFQTCVNNGKAFGNDRFTVETGMKHLSVHIPSCGPLTQESRIDSFRRAYQFFPDYVSDGILPIACHSWLLFKGNAQIMEGCRNMVDFLNDWEILESYETDNFGDDWRVFGMSAKDLSLVPRDTTLRRRVAEHLEKGGKMGGGFGIRLQTSTM